MGRLEQYTPHFKRDKFAEFRKQFITAYDMPVVNGSFSAFDVPKRILNATKTGFKEAVTNEIRTFEQIRGDIYEDW